MHYDKHRGCSGQVVKIGGNEESGYGDSPQQPSAVSCPYPFGDEVETTVVVQYFDDCHRCEQEKDNSRCLSNIFKEYVVVDEMFHQGAVWRLTGKEIEILTRMLAHDEIGAIAYIKNPTHRTHKHCYCRLVHVRKVCCCQEYVPQNEYQHYQ